MKMKIKITNQNAVVIEDELLKVNGKARSFTISSASEVGRVVRLAEQRLSVLPKEKWRGVEVTYCPAGPSAASYNYMAKSTRLTLIRGASDWFLVKVQPDQVRPKEKEFLRVEVSADQAAEIQRRAVSAFAIRTPELLNPEP